MKTSNICQIAPLPDYNNVSAMAENFETGNKRMKHRVNREEQIIKYILKSREQKLGSERRAQLIPEVEDQCNDIPMIVTKEIEVDEVIYHKCISGGLVFVPKYEQISPTSTSMSALTSTSTSTSTSTLFIPTTTIPVIGSCERVFLLISFLIHPFLKF